MSDSDQVQSQIHLHQLAQQDYHLLKNQLLQIVNQVIKSFDSSQEIPPQNKQKVKKNLQNIFLQLGNTLFMSYRSLSRLESKPTNLKQVHQTSPQDDKIIKKNQQTTTLLKKALLRNKSIPIEKLNLRMNFSKPTELFLNDSKASLNETVQKTFNIDFTQEINYLQKMQKFATVAMHRVEEKLAQCKRINID